MVLVTAVRQIFFYSLSLLRITRNNFCGCHSLTQMLDLASCNEPVIPAWNDINVSKLAN